MAEDTVQITVPDSRTQRVSVHDLDTFQHEVHEAYRTASQIGMREEAKELRSLYLRVHSMWIAKRKELGLPDPTTP